MRGALCPLMLTGAVQVVHSQITVIKLDVLAAFHGGKEALKNNNKS